ncbi:MAG TPA: hypothetical protein VGD69_16030 [Herpetosiphonaceae bacterium]
MLIIKAGKCTIIRQIFSRLSFVKAVYSMIFMWLYAKSTLQRENYGINEVDSIVEQEKRSSIDNVGNGLDNCKMSGIGADAMRLELTEDGEVFEIAGVKSKRLGFLLKDVFEDFQLPEDERELIRGIWEERILLAKCATARHRYLRELIFGQTYYHRIETQQELEALAEEIIFSNNEALREHWRQRLHTYDYK